MTDYASRAEAERVLRENLSDRYLTLDAFERVVSCEQYEGRVGFWDGSTDTPIPEREPVIKSHLVSDAIADNVSLLLGEGRFPDVTSRPGEDDSDDEEDADADVGLAPEQSEALDALIDSTIEQTRLRSQQRTVVGHAQGCGTGVNLVGFRNGKLFAETTRAKWTTPTFGPTGELESIEIRYPYIQDVKVNGQRRCKVLLYRRVIDRQRDVTFLPMEALEKGEEPEVSAWREDPSQTIEHGFGVVPAVWWKRGSEVCTAGQVDGTPIHKGLAKMVEAFDLALSLRHRSAVYLEPQWVEIGVEKGYCPTEVGRMALDMPGPDRLNPRAGAFLTQAQAAPAKGGARKKGPGWHWQYDNPEAKVQLLQANGDALRAIDEHAKDLEAKISQSLAVVFLDPNRVKYAGAMSGRALRMLKLRQIDRCAEEHDDWAENCLLPTLSLLCRIALLKRKELKLPKLKKALPVLARFAEGGTWTFPQLSVIRGPWFDSDPEEEKAVAETAALLVEKGLASRLAAVRKALPITGGQDPAAMLEAIEQDAEEKRQREQEDATERAKNEAAVFHAAGGMSDGSKPNADGAGARKAPIKPPVRGGSRRAPTVEP